MQDRIWIIVEWLLLPMKNVLTGLIDHFYSWIEQKEIEESYFFFGKLAAFWRRLEASTAYALSVTVNDDFERVRRWLKLLSLRFKLMMSKKMLLTASKVNYIILRKKTHVSHEINILETDRTDDWPTRKCKTDRQIWHVLI